jgi:hypothetical protein
MTLDSRSRFHLLGVAVGAVVSAWAAIQGDWWFAAVFGVATVVLRIRQAPRDP